MLSKQDKVNSIVLEQFLKSYEIYYGEKSTICLINDIMKEETIDFLPEQLKETSPKKLKRILSNIIKEDFNTAKGSSEYDLKPLSKYIHVKVSKKRVACAGLFSAMALASIISIGTMNYIGKTKQKQQIETVKNLELYDKVTTSSITGYKVVKKGKNGTIKSEIVSDNSQGENKLKEITKTTIEPPIENPIGDESTSIGDSYLKDSDELIKHNSETKKSSEEAKSEKTTKDILKLFNKELDGKKLTEKDLEIMSQLDEDLIIIKSEKENYNQITKDYLVTTEEDGTMKVIHSMTMIEKDFLTGQKIKSIPNVVDYTTVSEFIEKNDIERLGYQLSNNTFWGYKSVQKIDKLYGAEVIDCIQKYGLPLPVYHAKDFKKSSSKNPTFAKK